MRRGTAALALALVIGASAGCAELTTTGVPADDEAAVEEAAGAGEGHGEAAGEDSAEAAGEETEAFAETVVGMTTEEAQAAVEDAGYAYREVEIDGQPQAVTLDYRLDRVNVSVEDGVVTDATVG